jgi:hypothetical protein
MQRPNVIRLPFSPYILSRYSIQTLISKKGQGNELKNNGKWKSKPKSFNNIGNVIIYYWAMVLCNTMIIYIKFIIIKNALLILVKRKRSCP